MRNKHGFHQSANNWMTCRCGKVFNDSRKGKVTAKEKLELHLIDYAFERNGVTENG